MKKWSLLEMNEEHDISRDNMATLFVSTPAMSVAINLLKSNEENQDFQDHTIKQLNNKVIGIYYSDVNE